MLSCQCPRCENGSAWGWKVCAACGHRSPDYTKISGYSDPFRLDIIICGLCLHNKPELNRLVSQVRQLPNLSQALQGGGSRA